MHGLDCPYGRLVTRDRNGLERLEYSARWDGHRCMLSRGMDLGVENPGGPQEHPADGRKANENEKPGSQFAHQSQQPSQSVIHRLHHFVVNKFRSK